jgi:pyruvate kinase
MDIAWLNFSHGDRSEHERVYRAVRRAASDTGRAVGVLTDLQGPKIRLGRFATTASAGASSELPGQDRPGSNHPASQQNVRRTDQSFLWNYQDAIYR